ncbi:MAG: fibronectin type III domain-containing protein [Ruminococcus sp.]|nr:fibronectin type III domain-containing protein [Ruminococcus sp.]
MNNITTKKRLISGFLALAMVLGNTAFDITDFLCGSEASISAEAASATVINGNEFDTYAERTIQDVADAYSVAIAAGESYSDGDTSTYYTTAASLEDPYNAGVPTQDTLTAMQGMTNFYRWLLGLDSLTTDCTVSAAASYNLQEQAFCRNWYFAHVITSYSMPDGMDEDLWETGVPLNHNILAYGFTPRGSITGWLNEGYSLADDAWDSNLIGHRQAILSSVVSEIQYGFSGKVAIGKVVSKTNTMDDAFTAFPAIGYMPRDLVEPDESVWSVEINTDELSTPAVSDLTVTITNLSDGTTFTRNDSSTILVNTYTSSTCILFAQPDDYNTTLGCYDDSYQVVISGLKDTSGNAVQIQYTVDFVDISSYTTSSAASVETEFSKYVVYEGLDDTDSLNKIGAILPDTVTITTETGYEFEMELSGSWTLDKENTRWTNYIDESDLPSNVNDDNDILSEIVITYELTGENTVLWSKLKITPSSPDEGDSGTMAVYHYYSNYLGTRIYQVTADDEGNYTGTQRFDSQTSEEFDEDASDNGSVWQYYNIDSFTGNDSGTYISFYYYVSDTWTPPVYVCYQFQELDISHSYDDGEITTEATCTTDGVKTYTCTVCGNSYTETIEAVGYHTVVTDEAVDATCTESGLTAGSHCSVCGEIFEEQETIAATGHDYVSEVTTEATCTTDGLRTYTCSNCGDSYTEAIEATGHSYTSEVTTEATCTTDRVITYTCSNCGDTYTEVIPSSEGHSYVSEVITEATCRTEGLISYTCSECGYSYTEVIEATGHSYTSEVTTEATCGTDGVRTYTCTSCGDSYTETIEATGEHEYDLSVTTEATCTTDGVRAYTCSVCGDSYTEAIAATGHTAVTDEAVDATCTETGLTEGTHCSVCGEILVEQETVAATGHSYTSTITTAATCTTAGVRTYTCSVCGDSYTTTIAATGNHTYTSKITTAATCTTAGVRIYTCSVCGDSYTESIAATGHSYTTTTVAATYAAQGYTLYTCSVCGDSYKDNYTSKKTVPTVTASSSFTPTTSAVTINWTKVSVASGYQIQRYNSSSSSWTTVGTVTSGSTTSYKDSSLSAGTTYKYRVRAYVTYNGTKYYGSYSSTITTTTKPATVSAKSSYSSTTSAVRINWTKVSGASGYQVQRYNSTTKTWVTIKTITSGSTVTYKNSSLSAGTTYKYRVRAYKTLNSTKYYGSYSSTITTSTKPAKVTISSASKSTTAIRLNWKKVTGATGYKIQRYNSSTGKWVTIKTISSGSTLTYKNSGLKKGTTYKYRIRAYRKVNGKTLFGAYSAVKSVKTKS